MLKKLAELWIIFIIATASIGIVVFWFYVMGLMVYMIFFDTNVETKVWCTLMLLAMITATAKEIVDYS